MGVRVHRIAGKDLARPLDHVIDGGRARIACCSPHRGAIAGRRKGAARLRRPVGGPRAKTEGRGGHAGNSTSQEEKQVPKPSR